jgi:hypothetical protein
LFYGFAEIKYDRFTIRRTIKFYTNVVNVVSVYQRFFLFKKWTKMSTNFFLFDAGIMLKRRPPVRGYTSRGQYFSIAENQ